MAAVVTAAVADAAVTAATGVDLVTAAAAAVR